MHLLSPYRRHTDDPHLLSSLWSNPESGRHFGRFSGELPECRKPFRVPEADETDVELEEPPEVLPAKPRRPRDEDDDDDDERPRRRPGSRKRRKRRPSREGGLSARNVLFGGAIAFLGLLQILGGLTNENQAMKILGPISGLAFIIGGVFYAIRR